jgi:hypothetical protein
MWFEHVWRRPVDSIIRSVDQMCGSPIARERGRPRKTIGETMKKDLVINVWLNILYCHLVHVVNPAYSDKARRWLLKYR